MKNIISFPSFIIFISIQIFSCRERTPVLIDQLASDPSYLFSIDFSNYQGDISHYPIGVFDSGLGGLTVLSEILTLDEFNNQTYAHTADGIPDFANERFVYLGDKANMPYGNYSAEGKVDFLRELIVKDALFLLGTRHWKSADTSAPAFDKPPVKAIVIACNTATSYGLNDVLKAVKSWELPVYVIGVVNAGAKGAVNALNGKDAAVAVMATVGTCASRGYVRALVNESKKSGMKPPAIIQQGCLGIAGAVENDPTYIIPETADSATSHAYRGPAAGNPQAPVDTTLFSRYGFDEEGLLNTEDGYQSVRLNSVNNYIRYHALSLVEKFRASGESRPIETVILGCTHFPFYTEHFAAAFSRLYHLQNDNGISIYSDLLSENIEFIDPAHLTAEQLYIALHDEHILLDDIRNSVIDSDQFYISVPNSQAEGIELTTTGDFTYDYKYGRNQGNLQTEYVKRIPLNTDMMDQTTTDLIRENLPTVWERISAFHNSNIN